MAIIDEEPLGGLLTTLHTPPKCFYELTLSHRPLVMTRVRTRVYAIARPALYHPSSH